MLMKDEAVRDRWLKVEGGGRRKEGRERWKEVIAAGQPTGDSVSDCRRRR